MQSELSDTEASCHGAKWGNRHEHGLGIRQIKLNALHDFSKSQVTIAIVSDNVDEHEPPPDRSLVAQCLDQHNFMIACNVTCESRTLVI